MNRSPIAYACCTLIANMPVMYLRHMERLHVDHTCCISTTNMPDCGSYIQFMGSDSFIELRGAGQLPPETNVTNSSYSVLFRILFSGISLNRFVTNLTLICSVLPKRAMFN